MTYNDLAKKVACALIDADPTMSGYHETHIAVKLPSARAAMAVIAEALREVTPAMIEAWSTATPAPGEGWGEESCASANWRAMLAASPLLPAHGVAI
jgi:hypothetical protein